MDAPNRSFVFFPAHNQLPDAHNPKGNDATGAFQPGAEMYRKYYTGLGKAVVMCKFDNQAPAEKRRAQILNAMAVGAGEAWYDAVVYFGHGYKDGMPSAGFGPNSIDSLNDAIWNYGQYSVKVILYACSCAAEGGYAWRISESMKPWANEGYRVYGHLSAGHAFMNPQVRQYPNGGSVAGTRTAPASKIAAWIKALGDPKGTLWLRFPFMTPEEIEAEL